MDNPVVLCRLTGPIAVENDRTRNGTVYGSDVWDMVENSEEFREMMENKSFYIGLDHPEGKTRDSICSLLKETAGIVSEWKRQADGVIKVVIDVLDTPYGRIVNTLARYGSYIGLSTRAEGDLREDMSVVPDGFEFYGADFVTVPSQKASRMKLVMEESKFKKPTKRDLKEALRYAKRTGVNLKILESLRKDLNLNNVKTKEEEMKKIALTEGLKSKGYALLEGGFMRNLRTGRDSKILKENVNDDGSVDYLLRGGESVTLDVPQDKDILTEEERDVLDNYMEDEMDMIEGMNKKRRRMEAEGEEVEEEDDILYDEEGNPIIPEDEEDEEDNLEEGCDGEEDYRSREDMLAEALDKELGDDLLDEEEVRVDEDGKVIVEGKHCSIKIKGRFLEAYKGRKLVERCMMNRKDSLVGCIKVLRKDYNKR